MKPKVLFLCTGNSCRSQMAEGLARHYFESLLDAYSAGTTLHPLNQNAVQVMKEIGIDISLQHSKLVSELAPFHYDLVVTVCDNAAKNCPIAPHSMRILHVPFDDPPQLAANSRTKEEELEHYRRVRDEIKNFVLTIPSILETNRD